MHREPAAWNSSFDDSFFNNSRIVILINVILQFISFNNIFVHILFFCFFSFTGLTALYKTFRKYCPDKKYALIIGIFLLPSALFWTAGIYKGTLTVLMTGLLIWFTGFGLRKEYSKKEAVISIVLFLLLFLLKSYIAAAMLVVWLISFFYSRSGTKKIWISCLVVIVPLALLVYSFSMITERLDVFRMIADKQAKAISEAEGGAFLLNDRNFIRVDYYDEDALVLQPDSSYRIREGTDYLSWPLNNMQDTTFVTNSTDSSAYRLLYKVMPANTFLDLQRMEPNFISLLINSPSAILNVLLRPSVFDIHNAWHLFAAVENLWLLLLMVLTVICFDKTMMKYKEVLLFCLLFALIQFAVIGLTTPVVGAMVRYRATALPFLVTPLLLCLDLSKLNRFFRNSSKAQDS
jgi:hypothetical protein